MSDLHFEYHRDRGEAWIDGLNPDGVDVLILAGDIAEIATGGLDFVLRRFASRYPEVIFVPGNHEYYGAEISKAEAELDLLNQSVSNLHILRGECVVINRQRFLGATLWFTERHDEGHRFWTTRLNDFHKIKGGFETWVYSRAAAEAKFLAEELREGDVVVTHHIPSRRGVASRWVDSIEGFGRFFVHELPEDLICKSRLWVHGHGHDSVSSEVNTHQMISNPFGYLGHEENPEFKERLFIEL